MDDRSVRQMFALLHQGGVNDRGDRLALMSATVAREVTTTNDLSLVEIRAVVDTLNYWKRLGELPQRCRAMIESGRLEPVADTAPTLPLKDARGRQLVRVQYESEGREFTYAWAGASQLEIGDKVLTPSGLTGSTQAVATVCAFGSDYPGPITVLTKLYKKGQP